MHETRFFNALCLLVASHGYLNDSWALQFAKIFNLTRMRSVDNIPSCSYMTLIMVGNAR